MKKVLISCGATRNFIDPMRCITANASGKTGVQIASYFPNQTHLLGSPIAILRMQYTAPSTQSFEEFSSTRDLMQRMKQWITKNPDSIVVHSAAVGDYEAVEQESQKISSQKKEIQVRLGPTPKILNHIKTWSGDCFLISFKAASPETTPERLEDIARIQRERTNSDWVFANILGNIDRNVLLVSESQTLRYDTRKEGIENLRALIANQLA